MSISHVSASDLGETNGTSHSASFTVSSGTDRVLLLFGNGAIAVGGDLITGATYNSVAMTLVAKHAPADAGDYWTYVFSLAAPAAGAHNAVISASSATDIRFGAIEYVGVDQSVPVEASAWNGATGFVQDLTIPVTTLTDNAWVVGHISGFASSADLTANAGSTRRAKDTYPTWGIFDKNGATSPAGSASISGHFGGSSLGMGGHAVALRPAGVVVPSADTLMGQACL